MRKLNKDELLLVAGGLNASTTDGDETLLLAPNDGVGDNTVTMPVAAPSNDSMNLDDDIALSSSTSSTTSSTSSSDLDAAIAEIEMQILNLLVVDDRIFDDPRDYGSYHPGDSSPWAQHTATLMSGSGSISSNYDPDVAAALTAAGIHYEVLSNGAIYAPGFGFAVANGDGFGSISNYGGSNIGGSLDFDTLHSGDIIVTGLGQNTAFLGLDTGAILAWVLQDLGITGGVGTGASDAGQFDEPGSEANKAALLEQRDEIVERLEDSDFSVDGIIVVNGTTSIPLSLDSNSLATKLQNYDYFLNSTNTSAYGVGGSHPNYAIIDPDKIEDARPKIIVQGTPLEPEDYASWNWYILHEFAHQLLRDVDRALWNSWWENDRTGNYEDSAQFELNEQYADALVEVIAQALGLPIKSNVDTQLPTNPFVFSGTGYSPIGSPTPTPSPSPSPTPTPTPSPTPTPPPTLPGDPGTYLP